MCSCAVRTVREGSVNTGIMFLTEAALGREHHIKMDDYRLTHAPKGFDSIVAKVGASFRRGLDLPICCSFALCCLISSFLPLSPCPQLSILISSSAFRCLPDCQGSGEPDPSKDTTLVIDGREVIVPQGKRIPQPEFADSNFDKVPVINSPPHKPVPRDSLFCACLYCVTFLLKHTLA